MSTFLTSEEVAILTGRKAKQKQIEALRTMGLPFWVNAIGKPVIATAALAGRKEAPKQPTWVMPKINNGPKKHA